MTERHRNKEPTSFGKELHRLLAVVGMKRSAFGESGYTYSLHKQVCRGERPPSTRALGALKALLNRRLLVVLASAQRDLSKLDRLERLLAGFSWLHRDSTTGHWAADTTALGRLWQSRRAPASGEGLPILIEGTLIEPNMRLGNGGPSRPLRLKNKRFVLTTTEGGAKCLLVPLSPATAERLRLALSGQ